MQNISLDDIDASNLKNFFRKLSITSSRYGTEDANLEKATKDILKARIGQLEEELNKAIEGKNKVLKENRSRINELNFSLLSIKAKMNELLQARRRRDVRIRSLERKINEKVK